MEASSPSVADTLVGESGAVGVGVKLGGLKSSKNSIKSVGFASTTRLFPDLSITEDSLTYMENAKPAPGF